MSLGEGEQGTATLTDGVAAFTAALKVLNAKRQPFEWEEAQIGLGMTLMRLGERERGIERLKLSVAAFREALMVLPRSDYSYAKARAQFGLGTALCCWAEREVGTERLKEAIAILRPLARWPPGFFPPSAELNLGFALMRLGEREDRTELLQEASTLFRHVLAVSPRKREPALSATAHQNLKDVLKALEKRENQEALAPTHVSGNNRHLQEPNYGDEMARKNKSLVKEGVRYFPLSAAAPLAQTHRTNLLNWIKTKAQFSGRPLQSYYFAPANRFFISEESIQRVATRFIKWPSGQPAGSVTIGETDDQSGF